MSEKLISMFIVVILVVVFLFKLIKTKYILRKKSHEFKTREEHEKEQACKIYGGKEYLCFNVIDDNHGPLGTPCRTIYLRDRENREISFPCFDQTITAGSRVKLRPRQPDEAVQSDSSIIIRYMIPELMSHKPLKAKDSSNWEFWLKVFEELRVNPRESIDLDEDTQFISDSAAMNGQEGPVRGIFKQGNDLIKISCYYNGSWDDVQRIYFEKTTLNQSPLAS